MFKKIQAPRKFLHSYLKNIIGQNEMDMVYDYNKWQLSLTALHFFTTAPYFLKIPLKKYQLLLSGHKECLDDDK